VSPLSINDITSSFNISYDITLDQDFECMCGFEEKDIQEALTFIFTKKENYTEHGKQRLIEFHHKEMCDQYNGYKY